MKNWAETNSKLGANPQVGKYIGVYFAIGVGAALLTVVQTLILWIFCSIEVRSPPPSLSPLLCYSRLVSRICPMDSDDKNYAAAFAKMSGYHNTGFEKTARKYGHGHFQVTNVVFRCDSGW